MTGPGGNTGGWKSKVNEGIGRFILPALIFQSVAIGGAYATGREAVEFGAKYGALGWIAGLSLFVALSLLAFLVFELARRFGLFDYRSLLRALIGPFYWLFDVLYVVLATVILGVLASASGNILESTLGLNYFVGVLGATAIVAFVIFYGEGLVEKFNGIGTVLLSVGYILFSSIVITDRWDQIADTMSRGDHSLYPDVSPWEVMQTGLVYAGLYLVIFPSTLFTVRRQKRSMDTAIGGVVLGALVAGPWLLAYFSLMGFYPSRQVLEAPIPWLSMLDVYGVWPVVILGVLVGQTLIATGVGLIHATLLRVNQNLVDLGRSPMGSRASGMFALVTLGMAIILSHFGIIDLVAKGYTMGAYAMIVVFGVPLLIRGTYLIATRKEGEKLWRTTPRKGRSVGVDQPIQPTDSRQA